MFKNQLKDVSEETATFFQKMSDIGANVTHTSIQSMIDSNTFDDYIKVQNLADESLINFLKDANYGTKDLANYQQRLKDTGKPTSAFTSFTKKAGSALKSFGAAMGSMAINWAIGKVIDVVSTAFDNLANASKHAAENAQALASEMNESISSMSSNTSTLSDLNDEYQILSKGVNKLGENISLSTEDYSRYKDIISQLSTVMPDLTTYFNAQGEKIAFAKGELQDLNKEYDEYIHNQAIDFITEGDSEGNKIQDILDAYNNNESFTGFEKFWNNAKTSRGFGDIEDFTTKEIISELEELKKIESIDEFKYSLNNVKFKYSHSGGRDATLKYFIMEELGLTSKSRDEIESMTEANYNAIMQNIESYIQTCEAKIASDMNQVRTVLIQEAYSKNKFFQIEDKNIRNNIITFLSSIDSDIWNTLNKKTDVEVSTFVNGIIKSMSENEEGFADAWNGLFSPELEGLPVNEYLQQIDSFLKTICKVLGLDEKDGVPTLKISLGFDGYDDIPRRFQNAVGALINDPEILNSDEYAELVEIVNKLTIDEAELCLKAINDAESVTDAISGIKKALGLIDAEEDDSVFSLSISQTVDQLNTRLKPALDSLSSAWNDIFTDDNFALSSIDILSTCDSIKSKLDDLNEIEGITVDYSSFEDFVRALSNTESTEQNVETAFEALATSITQAALSGTEDFETMKAALEDLGIVNNEIVAFDALVRSTEALADSGYEQMKTFAEERISAENLTQAIAILTYQKKLCDLQGINTSGEVANLRTLAENAGYTGEVIQYLTELEQIYQQVENGTINPTAMGEKIDRIVQLKTLIESATSKIDYKPIEKAASSAGKSAGESFTDALVKELAALDKKMEAGYIDFDDYIQVRLGLIEDYYKQGKLSADEYYSYLEKHYDTQLSYMDQAVNAVTRRIDTELDALKQQKEDVENIYNVQIDSLEKEKTLLEEANRERQRQKDLQKSIYDMERARTQRTQLVYSEDKGMHYVVDDQAVRDAQENVDNARYDIQIAEIEKSVSNLEDARDKETSAIDDMISDLEAYKDAWSDVTSAYATEQENLIAAQILGADWETDILNSRLDVLNDFKNQYISIQQEMAAAWKSADEQAKLSTAVKEDTSDPISVASDISDQNSKEQKNTPQITKISGGGGDGNKLAFADFQAYASGTDNARKGLNLVGEDGAEAYFDNHGHVAIVTEPTLIPMEGGEVVKNERDTKKLLDPDNLAPANTVDFDDIDGKEVKHTRKVNAEAITLSDGTVLTPVQPGSKMYDMMRRFNTYWGNTDKNTEKFAPDLMYEHNRQMHETVNQLIGNNSMVNHNKNMQPSVTQNITLTCPNVTNNSGVEYIQRELGNLSQMALQESMKR